VAQALYERWITIFGAPEVIHSDRGTEFQNQMMDELCKIMGMRRSKSSPYYPQGNAIIERLFRTVKDMLYATVDCSRKNWTEVISSVEMALRCTDHSVLKFSPFEVVFGRKMATPLFEMKEGNKVSPNPCEYVKFIQDTLEKMHSHIRKSTRCHTKRQENVNQAYNVGESVMAKILPQIRGINNARYDGPYKIVGRRGKWCYVLKHLKTSKVIERNYYHLKRCRQTSAKTMEKYTSLESLTTAKEGTGTVPHLVRYPRRNRRAPDRYGYCNLLSK